jgi:4-amino-4-deoxy-L-arabinose transferase-like glycosyltransferase
MEKFIKTKYRWIVAAIIIFFATVSILNAKNDAVTFDEVAHIPASYSYVAKHDTRLNPEHPPLIKDMSGIPLLFLNLNFDTSKPFWTGDLPTKWDEGQWAAGKHLLYEAGNNPDQIIFWSRIPIILLSIIFGLFLFKWGKEIAGTSAGIFALSLYAFDPNILGHNHFVTTDIGIAAFFTFAFYYFLKFIKNPSWKNVFLGGLFLGLLLVTKFSSVVALPVFGLTLFIYALAKNNPEGENNWKTRLINLATYLLKGIAAFAIAAIVIWVVYKVNTYKMPKETFDTTIDFFFQKNLSPIETLKNQGLKASLANPDFKPAVTNIVLHSLNQSSITRPWSNYLFGPAWMFKRVSGGNGAYFLGEVGNGFKPYFPVVFLIKETLPILILIILTLLFTFKQSITTIIRTKLKFAEMKSGLGKFLRYSVSWYTMLIFIILYAYLSISGGLNIGFRHLFPILPFAYLLITKKTFDFIREKHEVTQKAIWILFTILMIWIVAEPIAAYPSYTSYFNELVGGSKNGYKYVTDSNTDWGQDLKRLKIWLDKHPQIDKIHVDYFGGGNLDYYLGDKVIPWYDSKRPVEAGWYAISENSLQGSIYDKRKNPSESYAWIKENNYIPFDQIGKSILIYYVAIPPLQQ